MENFKKQIQEISKKIKNQKDLTINEEATKQAFILPFFQVLGYNSSNLDEVVPEYNADIKKNKNQNSVDYCILKNKLPILLVECKAIGNKLGAREKETLTEYFIACVKDNPKFAKFAILTNGKEYQFYTDLSQKNIMDNEPFWQFDITQIKENEIQELNQFCKSKFNQEKILENAQKLKYKNLVYKYIREQFDNPNDKFAKFVLNGINDKATPNKKKMIKNIIKNTFNQIIKNKIEEQSNNTIKQKNNKNNSITDSENSGKLIVIFTDGKKFQDKKSVVTFIETIKKIGFKKVMDLNIKRYGYNIVNTQRPNTNYSFTECESYFITTHFSDQDKQKILQDISNELNLNLQVELLENK